MLLCLVHSHYTLHKLCYLITTLAPTLKLELLHPSETVCNNSFLLQGLWNSSDGPAGTSWNGLTDIFLSFNQCSLSADTRNVICTSEGTENDFNRQKIVGI